MLRSYPSIELANALGGESHGLRRQRVDCHAHIFARQLQRCAERRYDPDYDATADDFLRMLDANGMSNGVLVQPSFLGTDNSYLLGGLDKARSRLCGIAVVAPSVTAAELTALDAAGIVGIRLNLIGRPIPDFSGDGWPELLGRIATLGWQVEVQLQARRLESVMRPLLGFGIDVVVDHFGLPDAELGVDDPGFRHLLSLAASRRVWVKISAAYRTGRDARGRETALRAYPLLRDSIGLDRLIWGSDWPHTQFEQVESYGENQSFFETLVADRAERRQILGINPMMLFRFASATESDRDLAISVEPVGYSPDRLLDRRRARGVGETQEAIAPGAEAGPGK
jgi:predicted TIM-barrel fold metal-dependent hydrolase